MKKGCFFIIGLVFLASNSFSQQWAGSADINGNVYRTGNIGIGTNTSNGHISFGGQGTHLSIGQNSFLSKTILETSWNGTNGDYTDLRVPGAIVNYAQLRLQQNGNLGVGSGSNPIYERLQIGNAFLFHDGGYKKISYNNYFTSGIGGRRVEDGGVVEMAFTPAGELMIHTAAAGPANSVITDDALGLYISPTANVGIGTNSPGSSKLAVEGKISAREIRVTLDTPFPDYVFGSEYKLKNLDSLKTYIDLNKHLPGVPSAKEVEINGGVELGKMHNKMLEKIEELTLYVIELNNQIKDLKKENQALKNKFQQSK